MHASVWAKSEADTVRDGGRVEVRPIDRAGRHAEAGQSYSPTTHAIVVEIFARASGWRERSSPAFVAEPDVDRHAVRLLLDSWRANAASGDDESFEQRLALDGLDQRAASRALAPVRRAAAAPLPEWARMLERSLLALADADRGACDGSRLIPFIEIFAPLGEVAAQDVESCVAIPSARVAASALRALRNALYTRLARIAAPTLYERFDDWRGESAAHRDAAAVGTHERDASSRSLYLTFARGMLAGGIHGLFVELPALARAIATAAVHWRDASQELFERLAADRAAIAECFNGGVDPGEVAGIHAGCSDPHTGGRTVHLLRFASGLRLVYKPRSLGVDAAFGELLEWLAIRGAPLPAPGAPTFAARVLDRRSHGWAEYVAHTECADLPAARRYYQSSGALLALLHALGSSDCHYENIVAAGDRPVLVDLETILQHGVARGDPPRDHARNRGARLLFDDSVLRTGMLPIWQQGGTAGAYDTGGLSASPGQATPFASVRWSAVNSDAMCIHREPATTGAGSNLPRLGGNAISPAECMGDLTRGFARMYGWLVAHREEIMAPGGPLARMAREEVRFIVRPSSVYDYVLRRSLRGDALRDGAARAVELELLARGLRQLPRELWPILSAEQCALEQLDIPSFTTRGDSTLLPAGGAALRLTRSALDVARARFQSLDARDLERQLHIVRASFALRYFAEEAGTDRVRESASGSLARPRPSETATFPRCGAVAGEETTANEECRAPIPRAELIEFAAELTDEVGRAALTDQAGDPTWIVTEPVSTAGHLRLRAAGYGLYDGMAGIALFLAAASRCSGDSAAASLALRALAPLRSRLRAAPSYADEYGIGGAEGAASAVYALARTGILLNDDALLDDALDAARLISPAAVKHDASFDVLYGSAGAILALVALHRVRPRDWLVERALACGRHLLAARVPVAAARGGASAAWPTCAGGRAGFAHGAAGIALALFRLHAATGITEYATAAIDAVEADELLRSGRPCEPVADGASATHVPPGTRHSGHAWPPSREAASLGASWCRGSAGIGLVCLAPAAGAHAVELRPRAQRCISHVRARHALSEETDAGVCCGTMGEVELLLTAGLRWGDTTLLAAAHERASRVVRRLRSTHRRGRAGPACADVGDPALYRGRAGIGYLLLRLCHPELLPSFLSWE